MATKTWNLLDLGDTSYVFVEPVPHYLTCMICLGLIEKSVATNCCNKMMCESHWLKEKKRKSRTCPNCRHRLYTVSYNGAIDGIIKGLQVYCKHQDAGCDWKGDLSSEADHRKVDSGCQFEPILCKNKCGEKIKRKDMKSHLLDECPLRPSLCKYCSFSGTQGEVDSHNELCPDHPVTCPNGCIPDSPIPRKDLEVHLDVCPAKKIVCPFATGGCPVMLKKADMEEHMRTHLEEHLVCLFEQNCQFKKETELLKAREDRLEGEIQVLRQECHALKQEVELLKKGNPQVVLGAECDNSEESLDTLKTETNLKPSPSPSWIDHLLCTHANDTVLPATFKYSTAKSDMENDHSWTSPSFYTSSMGYRLCFTVVPNGHSFAQNKSLSVLFSVLPGNYDDYLYWPFVGKLNVSILNQNENANHHSMEVDFDEFPAEEFSQVYDEDEEGEGWGILRFIKHTKLCAPDSQYLANNTMYIHLSCIQESSDYDTDSYAQAFDNWLFY